MHGQCGQDPSRLCEAGKLVATARHKGRSELCGAREGSGKQTVYQACLQKRLEKSAKWAVCQYGPTVIAESLRGTSIRHIGARTATKMPRARCTLVANG